MKEKRTLEEVQKEYNQLCPLIGHQSAQIKGHEMNKNKAEDELRKLMDRMSQVILESTRLLKEKQLEGNHGSTETGNAENSGDRGDAAPETAEVAQG